MMIELLSRINFIETNNSIFFFSHIFSLGDFLQVWEQKKKRKMEVSKQSVVTEVLKGPVTRSSKMKTESKSKLSYLPSRFNQSTVFPFYPKILRYFDMKTTLEKIMYECNQQKRLIFFLNSKLFVFLTFLFDKRNLRRYFRIMPNHACIIIISLLNKQQT